MHIGKKFLSTGLNSPEWSPEARGSEEEVAVWVAKLKHGCPPAWPGEARTAVLPPGRQGPEPSPWQCTRPDPA